MTVAGLDFRNPKGLETFNCFKRVCIIEPNTNESTGSDSILKEAVTAAARKIVRSSYNVFQEEMDDSDNEDGVTVYAATGKPTKPWNPPAGLRFPCRLVDHIHEMSKCTEFFNLTPLDRWEQIEKFRMSYSCLKRKTVCKGKKCLNVNGVPEVLKCVVCAFWA